MTAPSRRRALTTELDFELYFVTEVLKLSSLHYGYWEGGQASGEFDLDEIRRAQELFTEKLIAFVPKDTETILDVGAGVGDNARALADAGYRVTAISPDRNHARYFEGCENPNLVFQRSKFEEFESDEKFDLLLFSESHRYFNRRVGMRQSRQLVRPGGHLLVCGMFRHKKSFPEDFDLANLGYIRTAREFGFVPETIVDITPNVLPTMEIANRAMKEYLEPTLQLADEYLSARAPWKARVIKFLFATQGKDIDRMIEKYRQKSDPDRYREQFRYLTILFRDSEVG